jgi:hypothetical protein
MRLGFPHVISFPLLALAKQANALLSTPGEVGFSEPNGPKWSEFD